jgi:uncharacterized tellurite resistance protein B-like protein
MLEKINTFIANLIGDNPLDRLGEAEMRVACAALLVHCAKADGYQSPEETARLREILTARYGLTGAEVDELIEEAERREAESVDVHKFTRVLHQNLDRAGRQEIVRLLWEISHADHNIDYDERRLVTLVAGLLDVEIHDAVALRRDVEGKRED